MKIKTQTLLTAAAVFCLISGFGSARSQVTDDSRQLQQPAAVSTFPSKAKRWAIVIGIDKYTDPQISPLKGADNDARLLSDSLIRYAGFPQDQVILLSTDQPVERQPTRTNILRRLSNLASAVPKDGLLLISFAGHGMERSGQAFLLPSDAQISDQISFLEDTAIGVNRIKDQIKQIGVSQVVMLLDACRNDPGGRADAPNPLTNAYVNAFNFDVRNREVQAFATIYATGIGQRAYEYTEKKQGYFSWAVVEGLKGSAANDKGEITLAQLVKFVQEAVPKRIAIDLGSTKQQKPFAVIEGYRADELVVAVTNSASMPMPSAASNMTTVDPAAIELSFWDSIKNSNNPDDFKAYLDKYPDGQFASLAKLRAQPARSVSSGSDSGSMEMTYWNAIKDSKSSADFQAYLTKFPNGFFADLAKSRMSALEADERERARERARIEAMSVDGTNWVGDGYKFQFTKGGVFGGTHYEVVTIPGLLFPSYKPVTTNFAGTWKQNGDTVTIQLSQPQADMMSATVNEIKLSGASAQGTYKFALEKILRKPLQTDAPSASGCDFHGFKAKIIYRKKDKVDRTDEAKRLGERLKSLGIEVELEQFNWKDYPTGLTFYNEQGDIAVKLGDCIKDVLQLKASDGGANYTPNKFIIYLQL